MGKHVIVLIFLFMAMTSLTFSAEVNGQWDEITQDVQRLSRSSFYEKYREQLKSVGVESQVEGEILNADSIEKELSAIEEIFYAKGYSQWQEVTEMKEEFGELYESSAGAYSVLKRRIHQFNLQIFKNENIGKEVKDSVNDRLSILEKKIEKHFQAKSSIPSRATMVAALGKSIGVVTQQMQNSTQRGGEVVAGGIFEKVKSLTSSVKNIEYFGAGALLLLSFVAYRRRSKKETVVEYVKAQESILGEGLNRTGVLSVNSYGEIESMNLRASELFSGLVRSGDSWDKFFQKNFYRGKKHLGVKGFYRFAHNSEIIFYVNGHLDKETQQRTIEVSQMSLKDFDSALSLLERSSIKVDSMDIFDNVFSELINLGKINLSLDVFNLIHFGKGSDYLYLSELESRKYISRVLKTIDSFYALKNTSEITAIDISREGSDFLVKATFNHCSVNEQDLAAKVSFEEQEMTLNDVLTSFQGLSHSYDSSLFVKNLTINGERRSEMKFKIQDNSNFTTIQRVKNTGRFANA